MARDYIVKVTSVATNNKDWLVVLYDKDRGRIYLRLSTLDWRKLNDRDLCDIYEAVNSDGCSGVPDFYLSGCVIHDFHYRTHRDFDGHRISRAEADRRLRQYIQDHSKLGVLNPMAIWRWLALRIFGSKAWKKKEW